MIECKTCGYCGAYTGKNCPACHRPLTLSTQDIRRRQAALAGARAARDVESERKELRILADFGVSAAQRDYARMLETGGGVQKDVPGAVSYYRAAADQGDAYAAYRLGMLLPDTAEEERDFWVCFAAALDCAEAYLPASRACARRGEDTYAAALLEHAAQAGEREALVLLAAGRIHTDPPTAAWYIRHVREWSVRAWWLRLRLWRVGAVRPDPADDTFRGGFLRDLYRRASGAPYAGARFCLCRILAERYDASFTGTLGTMMAAGEGCEADFALAQKTLCACAEAGHPEAYLTLAQLYRQGTGTQPDISQFVHYATLAADGGCAAAYEQLGAFYTDADNPHANFAYGITLYEEGAKLGSAEADQSACRLRARREQLYREGQAARAAGDAQGAFRCYAVSSAMGYGLSDVALGRCYEEGYGTPKDRHRAFLWYNRAAENDISAAYLPLGLCYAQGIGIRRDYRNALRYLRLAAGVQTDPESAARAAEFLRAFLARRRARCVRELYGSTMALLWQKKYLAAAELAATAASLGDAKSAYTLGCLFEFGCGVDADRERAARLYAVARAGGFDDVRARYKKSVLRLLH